MPSPSECCVMHRRPPRRPTKLRHLRSSQSPCRVARMRWQLQQRPPRPLSAPRCADITCHVPSVPLTRRGLLPCSCTSPRPTAGRGICHLQQRPRGCRHTFKGDPGTTKMLATIYRYLSLYVHRACRQDCTLLCVLRIAPDTSRHRRRHTH